MADHNHLIASKLTQQVSCLESIAALLDDELTAIAAKRGDGLKSIAQQKISLLQQIQTIDKEVQKLVAHNESQDDEVSALIKQVNTLLASCKKKNDVNAHAAHQAQLSVKQLKDILIGAPSSMTYDQGGKKRKKNTKTTKQEINCR